jgi:hypothetical protein
MHDDDYKKFSTSLAEMAEQVQSNLPHAKRQGFEAVSINVSLDVAQELLKAVEQYQEPNFCGWPLSLVDAYLEHERDVPSDVMEAYTVFVTTSLESDDTTETFFTDEAYEINH